jgi:hypothetical protein
MRISLAITALTFSGFLPSAVAQTPIQSAVYHPTADSHTTVTKVAEYRRHRRRRHGVRKTAKRVGIGAAGGAAVGALAGGGTGAAIGALAGGGAGAVYDHHEKKKGN